MSQSVKIAYKKTSMKTNIVFTAEISWMHTMKSYKKNIVLDYIQLGFRSFNVTNVIWLLYLLGKGFSPLDIGIFESIFHISSLIVEIPSGVVADVVGRKKSRIIGVLLYLIYIIVILYSNNFFMVSLAFVLCGASYAFESGSGEALIYDSLKLINEEDKFIKISGNREIIFQLSSTIALFIGGYLALVNYEFNYIVVFFAFVMALIPILLMSETQPKKHENYEVSLGKMNDLFKKSTLKVFESKSIVFLIVLGAFLAAPVTSLFFYFQIYLSDSLSYSENIIGILLAGHSLAGAIGGYYAAKLEKKYQEKLLLYIVPLFMVLSFWLVQVDLIVFVPFVLLGFLDSLLFVVISDYINRIIPSENRATILSFSSFSFSVIMIVIFPIIGAIASYSTFKLSFLFLAIMLTIVYITLIIFLRFSRFKFTKNRLSK